MLVASTTFVALGNWQLRRYAESAERSAAVLDAWHLDPVATVPPTADVDLAHRRAHLHGTWTDADPQLFHGGLVGGEPGYQLVVALRQDDGATVLVDRGWVPVGLDPADVRALTPPGTPADVEGLLERAEGRPDLTPTRGPDGLLRWPLDTDRAFGLFPRALGPPFAAIVAAAATPLAPWVLRAGPSYEPDADRHRGPLPVGGYVLPLPRTHHLSYAAQWFGFAGLTVLLWGWASTRRSGDEAR